jgi:hypothetical protein
MGSRDEHGTLAASFATCVVPEGTVEDQRVYAASMGKVPWT